MVHITGGGLPGNIKRVIPEGLIASIHVAIDSTPRIFRFIMELGNINFHEMCSTFNMGTGYVLIVGNDDEKAVIDIFEKLGEKASLLGYIEKSTDDQKVRLI
jgi:phosphoribosylformylglycinamidine cyclo-ligase